MHWDVVIVGGGPVGWAAAKVFEKHGRSVALLEGPKQPARQVALLNPSERFLNSINIRLSEKETHRVETLAFWDKEQKTHFQHPHSTHLALSVSTETIVNTIKTQSSVYTAEAAKAIHKHTNGWKIITESGETIMGDVLVGADGSNSIVAKAVRSPFLGTPTGHSALSFAIAHDVDNRHTSVEHITSAGPLNTLPTHQKHHDDNTPFVSHVVWMDWAGRHKKRTAKPIQDILNDLNTLTNGQLGHTEALTHPVVWNTRMGGRMKMVSKDWLLLGEAAHQMPPVGAQGLNLAMTNLEKLNKHLCQAGCERRLNTSLLWETHKTLTLVKTLLAGQSLPKGIGSALRKPAFDIFNRHPNLKRKLVSTLTS